MALAVMGPMPGICANFLLCLLYTSDAADDLLCVDLGGRRIIKKKKTQRKKKKKRIHNYERSAQTQRCKEYLIDNIDTYNREDKNYTAVSVLVWH